MAAVALRASPTSLAQAALGFAIASPNYVLWSGIGAPRFGWRPAGEGAARASDGVANCELAGDPGSRLQLLG